MPPSPPCAHLYGTLSIGRGLLELFVSRPNTTVIAAVRDPSSVADELHAVAAAQKNGSHVIIVKVDSGSRTDVLDAVKVLRDQGVSQIDAVSPSLLFFTFDSRLTHLAFSLDQVVANSGIVDSLHRLDVIDPSDVVRHFEINVSLWPLACSC